MLKVYRRGRGSRSSEGGGGRMRMRKRKDEMRGNEVVRRWEEEGVMRRIGHIIHESDLRTIYRCNMSIYSVTSFNMYT